VVAVRSAKAVIPIAFEQCRIAIFGDGFEPSSESCEKTGLIAHGIHSFE
jgi:hypothetical protein